MSAVRVGPTKEGETPDPPPIALPLSKTPRVLACVLCQQRKVKCDRKYPCANCVKSRVQCVPPAQVPGRRRRRFPERELLDRLRKYEDLLRQNNITFDPLHGDSARDKESPNAYDSDDDPQRTMGPDGPSPLTTVSSEGAYEAKNIWQAMSQEFRDPNSAQDSSDYDLREVVFKKAWDQLYENDDHLLFGLRKTAVDIYTLHPEPVQIFQLWQLYLENVNPLLKVTHTPSLQGRIIEAAGNLSTVNPTLESLMFGIYCMSILSLDEDDCFTMFSSSKVHLLTKYQFGCQQALSNCGFLRSGERDCLTALFLYLISIRSNTVPQSLSSMLGVAIRIAQRMGIHNESALSKYPPLEAEMRRRLWWSLMLFDTRICEMAGFRTATLTPTWDCKFPLNANDSDFHIEMKQPPQVQEKPTESIFALVRSELANYIRKTTFHLDLRPIAKDDPISEDNELVRLEKRIEDKYLKFCDPENPLHFMTIWMSRGYLAKCHFVAHHFRYSDSPLHQAEAQRDAAISYAFRMLECDTKIMTSPLTKGFHWLTYTYFPFPAYIQIAQHLKWRPLSDQAERAWEVMSDSYESRFGYLRWDDTSRPFHNPFFKIFTEIILQSWEAREAAFKLESLVTPRIVVHIRHKLGQMTQDSDKIHPKGATDMDNNFPTSMGPGFDNGLLYNMGGQDGYGQGPFPDMSGLAPLDVDINQLEWLAMDWSSMDWNMMNVPGIEVGEAGMY